MRDEARYLVERKRMVEEQVAARGLHDARLLEAMRSVPRHCFVPPEYNHLAYADGPLPIGCGQTMGRRRFWRSAPAQATRRQSLPV